MSGEKKVEKMRRNSFATWGAGIALGVVAAAAIMIVAIPMYLSAAAGRLHPEPQGAPSVMHAEPSPQWLAAVERARQISRAGLADQNLPGLSVAVGAAGDIVWAEGFGWKDLRAGVPVTPDTRFRIGSASAMLTSAGAGVLLERNLLHLDETIPLYVPQFPQKAWPVTVRQVMGHTAGLTTDSRDDRPLSHRRCESPADAVPHFADQELMFEPGTQYRHSHYGWVLASAAVEAAADEPFLTFMREQVFEPLGMDDTGAESATEENPEDIGGPGEDPPPFTLIHDFVLAPLGLGSQYRAAAAADPQRPATFYATGFGPRPVFRHALHERHPRNLSCYAGSMAFFSTPSDLARFGLALSGGTLLQPATVETLQTSQPLASGQQTGQGLGWDIATVTIAGAPARAVGHVGESWGGRVASLLALPEHGIVVAVMSNVAHANTAALAARIAEAFAQ